MEKSTYLTTPKVYIAAKISPTNKILRLLTISITIFLFFLIGVGTYLIETKEGQKLVSHLPQQIIVAPTLTPILPPATPIPTIDQTANWQTFTYLLASVKLPSDWKEISKKNPIQLINYDPKQYKITSFDPEKDAGKLKIDILATNSTDAVTDYVIKKIPSNIIKEATQTTIIIDNQQAIKVKTPSPGFTVYVKVPTKQIILAITLKYDFDKYQDLALQILSTIQFTITPAS